MAAGRKKRSTTLGESQNYTTTRGVTSTQKTVNRSTGVNNSYFYVHSGAAKSSASSLAQLPAGYENMSSSDQKRITRNINRRKSNGGSGS